MRHGSLRFTLSIVLLALVTTRAGAQALRGADAMTRSQVADSQRVLSDLDEAIVGNVRYRDAALGGVPHIDIVQPDAEPGDDSAMWRGINQRGRHIGPVGHDGIRALGKRDQRRQLAVRRDDQVRAMLGQDIALDI